MCDSVPVIANNRKACIICSSKESLVSYFVLYHVIIFCYSEKLFPKFGLIYYFEVTNDRKKIFIDAAIILVEVKNLKLILYGLNLVPQTKLSRKFANVWLFVWPN